jgi:K(+)-stimulated pyrophosphate-energized sodium pump
MVGVVVFVFLLLVLGLHVALGFLIGAVLSGAAGYIGMNVSVRANVRTAQAATQGLQPALDVAFRAGADHRPAGGRRSACSRSRSTTACCCWMFGDDVHDDGLEAPRGAVVRRLADLDLRASRRRHLHQGRRCRRRPRRQDRGGIPEDDPRNPAVIADNVGDNVGDCAGMAADLFETYASRSSPRCCSATSSSWARRRPTR